MPNRRILAVVAAGFLTLTARLTAHETDQYSVPVGREFADLRFYFSEQFHDAIKYAVEKVNARIRASLRDGQATVETRRLQSPDYVAGAVVWEFPPVVNYVDVLEMELRSPELARRFPGLVVAHLPTFWIYHHWALVLDPTKLARWWRCSTVMIDGTLLGTDKIAHFVHMGFLYFGTYRASLASGASEAEALRSAVEFGNGASPLSERTFLGLFSSGVISNADLAADYSGMMFFRNLTEPVRLRGRETPPMLERDGEFFRLAARVNPHSDFFKFFVSDHWNELFNPNEYQWGMEGFVREEIAKRCDDVLDWYRRDDGRRMTRADFRRKLEESRTLFGDDYGQGGNITELLSLLNTCFDSDDGGDAARPSSVDTRDAFGRTALWRASRAGRVEEVGEWLRLGAKPDAADLDGETAMHAAARAGHAGIIRRLVSAGGAVQVRSAMGVTPLHLASREDQVEAAKVLLEARANPNDADVYGCTPLHDAASRDADEIAFSLLEAGADPRARDRGESTPLHHAARAGSVRVAMILRSEGASALARNRRGLTPIDEAEKKGFRGLGSVLANANLKAGKGQGAASSTKTGSK